LDATLRQEVAAFSNDLRRVGAAGATAGGAVAGISGDGGMRAGQVSLEFYQKKRRWPFAPENIPWEVWTIRTDLVHFANEHERQHWQEKVGEMLADKVMYIAEVMNLNLISFFMCHILIESTTQSCRCFSRLNKVVYNKSHSILSLNVVIYQMEKALYE
jgi:hypothetical protein